MELHKAFVLPPFFWTEASPGEHQDQRITVLQLQQRAARAAVVRPLVVGKDRTRNDVRPHDDPYACAA